MLKINREKESGQALVEYVLLLMLVGVVAVGGLHIVGGSIGNVFTDINCQLQMQDNCTLATVNSNVDQNNDDADNDEGDDDDTPCSSTDTPTFQAQCIGGTVYLTVNSTCEDVDSSSISIDPDGLLGLETPLNISLAKEPDGFTLAANPINNVGLCVGVDTSTFSVTGTVYYTDGATIGITVN